MNTGMRYGRGEWMVWLGLLWLTDRDWVVVCCRCVHTLTQDVKAQKVVHIVIVCFLLLFVLLFLRCFCWPSSRLPVFLCPSVHPSVCLSVLSLSGCLSVCLSL